MWTNFTKSITICLFSFYSLAYSQTQVNVSLKNNLLAVINSANGDTVISSSQVVWKAFTSTEHPKKSLAPSITMQTAPNGCSLTFVFNNTTSDTLSLGKISIGGVRFGNSISARDFFYEGGRISHNSPPDVKYTAFNTYYPKQAYSPVMVVNDATYTLCFSLHYPVLDYKHNVRMNFTNEIVDDKKSWTALFKLNELGIDPDKLDFYSAKGDLPPGEQRTYTLFLRVLTNSNPCEPWLTGLQPYKDYFRSLYGGVAYENDPRPIRAATTALQTLCNATNPYGFINEFSKNNLRPDLNGFGPLSRNLKKICEDTNVDRIFIIRPTGSYWKNKHLNIPYKFTSHWLEGDTSIYPQSYGHKMGDATDSLKILSSNIDMGFWWGRAGQVMFNWDTNYFEVHNPYNPVHVAIGYKELDLAVQSGAKFIGLDAFRLVMPAWDGYVWLQMMRQRAPNMRFITEQYGCDFLHTLAGIERVEFIDKPVSGPHFMSDFLLPGSEKIIWLRSDNDTTEAMRIAKMNSLNSWGFTAVNPKDDTLKSNFLAHKSWYKNIPYPDLGLDACVSGKEMLILNAKHKNSVSYLWSTGDTTSTISVGPGTYYVQTSTSAGCIAADTIRISACATGIADKKADSNSITIYPNPYHSQTTIRMNNYQPGDRYSFAMYNTMGEKVKGILDITDSELTLSTDEFSPGVYILEIRNHNEIVKIEKLLIQ